MMDNKVYQLAHDLVTLTQRDYEKTDESDTEYKYWHKNAKGILVKLLKLLGASVVEIAKRNYYDLTGYFALGEQWYYIAICDIRDDKMDMLIRKVEDNKDTLGQFNQFVNLTDEEAFVEEISKILGVK